jgi:lipoprotein-releasing system ATP-binding protein
MLVELGQVHKSYGSSDVLKGIDLSITANNHLVIQGASGSGKSTLLYILGALEAADRGSVKIDGQDLARLNDEQLSQIRNQFIGFVFQFHFLLPSMRCMQNILLPAKIAGQNAGDIEKKTREYAQALNVTHCLDKYPYQISGGEQQRINIIRAVSLNPSLILCDEPTGNLDSKNTSLVISMLKELAAQINSTLVVVTHDNSVAAQFQDKITIEDGQIIG